MKNAQHRVKQKEKNNWTTYMHFIGFFQTTTYFCSSWLKKAPESCFLGLINIQDHFPATERSLDKWQFSQKYAGTEKVQRFNGSSDEDFQLPSFALKYTCQKKNPQNIQLPAPSKGRPLQRVCFPKHQTPQKIYLKKPPVTWKHLLLFPQDALGYSNSTEGQVVAS